MQRIPRPLPALFQNGWHRIHGGLDGVANQALLGFGGPRQHVLDARLRRLADADPQAPELIAELRDEIADAVVARGATALLQLHDARREIQLIVRDENLLDGHFVERRDAARRAAAAVHVRHRLHQPDLMPADPRARELALMLRFVAQRGAMAARQLVDEPEAGVVTRVRVLVVGIAETDDELEWSSGHDFRRYRTPGANTWRPSHLTLLL